MSDLADNKSPLGKKISEVAGEEGGTHKGSTSAQMQSEATKQRNFESAASDMATKMDTSPSTVIKEDASLLHSRESRALGGQRPPKGSISSQAQSLAAENEQSGDTTTATRLTPQEQSHLDRDANYVEVADKVGTKMEIDPDTVTKEDANTLHSRETKAFGTTEKGGLAAEAQRVVSQKER